MTYICGLAGVVRVDAANAPSLVEVEGCAVDPGVPGAPGAAGVVLEPVEVCGSEMLLETGRSATPSGSGAASEVHPANDIASSKPSKGKRSL